MHFTLLHTYTCPHFGVCNSSNTIFFHSLDDAMSLSHLTTPLCCTSSTSGPFHLCFSLCSKRAMQIFPFLNGIIFLFLFFFFHSSLHEFGEAAAFSKFWNLQWQTFSNVVLGPDWGVYCLLDYFVCVSFSISFILFQ